MLKKFLRTSVLTLGAGLCVLATLQNESHALIFDNEYNEPLAVTTGFYLKYKNLDGKERFVWGGKNQTNIVAERLKTTLTLIDQADLEQLMKKLDQDVREKGGIPIVYGFSIDANSTHPGKEKYSNSLYNDANDINSLEAAMQRPVKAFFDPEKGLLEIE